MTVSKDGVERKGCGGGEATEAGRAGKKYWRFLVGFYGPGGRGGPWTLVRSVLLPIVMTIADKKKNEGEEESYVILSKSGRLATED